MPSHGHGDDQSGVEAVPTDGSSLYVAELAGLLTDLLDRGAKVLCGACGSEVPLVRTHLCLFSEAEEVEQWLHASPPCAPVDLDGDDAAVVRCEVVQRCDLQWVSRGPQEVDFAVGIPRALLLRAVVEFIAAAPLAPLQCGGGAGTLAVAATHGHLAKVLSVVRGTPGAVGPARSLRQRLSSIPAPLLGAVPRQRLSPDATLCLVLLHPACDFLWNRRKVVLLQQLSEAAVEVAPVLLVRELLLTGLLLSRHHKQHEVWQHRLWTLAELVRRGGVVSCAEAVPPSRVGVPARCLQEQDAWLVRHCGAQHPMNYSAFLYKRQAFRLFQTHAPAADHLWSELRDAVAFLEQHNGDSSCVAYLIFLSEGTAVRDEAHASRVWKELMLVSTREIRRHWQHGHAAPWILRLALISLAERLPGGAWGSWSARDELELVDHFASMGGAALPLGADTARDFSSDASVSWVDCTGSWRWSSFYACQYGVQLCRLLARQVSQS